MRDCTTALDTMQTLSGRCRGHCTHPRARHAPQRTTPVHRGAPRPRAPPSSRAGPHRLRAAAAQGAVDAPAAEQLAAVSHLQSWLSSSKGMAPPLVEPKRFKPAGAVERVGFIATRDTDAGTTLISIPEAAAITAIDAESHPVIGE